MESRKSRPCPTRPLNTGRSFDGCVTNCGNVSLGLLANSHKRKVMEIKEVVKDKYGQAALPYYDWRKLLLWSECDSGVLWPGVL